MFSNDNNDGKYLDPSFPSSNLAALFESEKFQSTSSNTKDISLSYTAPRQPKSLLNQENADLQRRPASSVVFCAKIITLTQATPSLPNIHRNDRLGLALIGNDQQKAYELILYKDKQSVIYRMKLESSFVFTIDNNNKSAFFNDDTNALLGVTFQSEEDCNEFGVSVETKGAQTIYQKVIVKQNLSFSQDITCKSKPLIIPKTPKETLASTLTTNDRLQYEQKENVGNNLTNEAFNYLANSRKEEIIQNHRQLHRMPIFYKAAQVSDMNSPFNQAFMTDNINSIITETRSQNCEMRMHMLQMSLKLDTLLKDVSDVKTQTYTIHHNSRGCKDGSLCRGTTNSNMQMEFSMNDIKKENEKMRQLEKQQLYNDYVKRLEKEHSVLKCHLEDKDADLLKQLSHVDNLNQKVLKLQRIDVLNKENINSLDSKCKELLTLLEMQKLKLSDFAEHTATEKMLQQDVITKIDASIKETMNKLYQNLLNAFDSKETSDRGQIETAIIVNLRKTSYEMMENVKCAVNAIENIKDNQPKK